VDLALWQFAERTHPVYERPAEATRWPFARPVPYAATEGVEPAEYEEGEEGLVSEPLQMSLEAVPSADWYQKDASGNTVLTLRLHSGYAPQMDLDPIRQMAGQMYDMFRALSRGPLSYRDLRLMGHPYGYGQPEEELTWRKLGEPRKVSWRTPEGESWRHIAGIRGSVATMAVVHRHTGQFEAAWRHSLMATPDGVVLTFWNERKSERGAPVAFFLAHGTVKMQAHGPWETVPRWFWPRLVNAWRAEARRASMRQRALEGQFGTAGVD